MKASTPHAPEAPKAARTHKKRPARRCRRCPFCGPWGQCLDRRRKSGRCGDWVWYLRGGKQCRRLYVKPQNPRTPGQRDWQAQFGAASKRYSRSLTEEQRDACIAAGAKLRSRPRLGQSGPLTGQQYWIRRDYAAKAAQSARDAKRSENALQTKGILPSTPGTHRGIAGPPSGHHRLTTGRGGKEECRRMNDEARRRKAMAVSGRLLRRRIARAALPHGRHATRAKRRQAASNRRVFPISGRASVLASPRTFRPLAKARPPQRGKTDPH